MLDVDATVLDPVLAGTLGNFLDPHRAPGSAETLLVAADPTKPDAVATTEAVRHYARDLERRRRHRQVTDVGHLIHDEKAGRDQFGAAVLTFLDRLAAP